MATRSTTARRRRVLGPKALFAFVTVPLLVTAMQYHMVSVGLADMIDDLGAPLRWTGWVVTIFTVASASSQPIAGRLGESLGSHRVFAAGLGLFSLSSLCCALAPNVYVLIGTRFVQGIASGTVIPTAYALIAAAFPAGRARAIGLISSVLPIGTLAGPNLGGVIVEEFGWRVTFAINVPAGALLAAGAMVLLPATERRRGVAIDVRGSALLAAAVFAIVYALTELAADAPQAGLVAASTIAALVLTTAFVRLERRVAAPIIDLDLLRGRTFAVTNLLNFSYGVALLGLFGFIPLYAQTVYGMSPSESGLVLTPRALAMVVFSTLSALLLPIVGYRKPIVVGLVVQAISAVVLALSLRTPVVLGVTFSDFAWVTLVVALVGVAYGLIGPPLTNAGIELAPDRVAAMAGLRGTFRSLGGATGTALIVLVVSRASTDGRGLEIAFAGIGALSLACILLVRWIPDGTSPATARPRPTVGGGERQTAMPPDPC